MKRAAKRRRDTLGAAQKRCQRLRRENDELRAKLGARPVALAAAHDEPIAALP